MWDIVEYIDSDMSLLLRSQGKYAVFSYPWDVAKASSAPPVDPKAQSINIAETDLFSQLAARVRFHAFFHACQLARSGMNGKIPRTFRDIHVEALKFSLRRFEKNLIKAHDFLPMLRSCAVIDIIPDGFWKQLSQHASTDKVSTVQTSMRTLSIFHAPGMEWIDDVMEYMSGPLWFANEFTAISTVAKQLAIVCHDHPLSESLHALGAKASSMMLREEILQEQETRKPWQKSAPTRARGVRIGPRSAANKKLASVRDDKSDGEEK